MMTIFSGTSRTGLRIALLFVLVLSLDRCCQLTGTCESSCSPTDPTCGGQTSGQQSGVLAVPYIAQQTPEWCWAATSEMIFRYYGVNIAQCVLVSAYVGRQCCVFDPYCVVPSGSMETIQLGLSTGGGIRSQHVGPLTFNQIIAEIDAGRPIMAGYRGSFAGHVVLIVGYDRSNSFVKIHDPFYGVFNVPYGATFTYGGQLVWTDSLIGIAR